MNSGIPDFIEAAPYEKGFRSYYQKNIVPLLAELEEERKRRLWQLGGVIGLLTAFDLTLLVNHLNTASAVKLLYITLFIGIAAAAGFSYWYDSDNKEKILPLILRFMGELDYMRKRPFDISSIASTGVFPGYTSASFEDHIYGTHEGTYFELCEARLSRQAGKSSVTVFRGLFVIMEGGPFTGTTLVLGNERSPGDALFGFSDLKKVGLVDPIFENRFEVYSTDQVEARYLVNPALMEKLLQLNSLIEDLGTGRSVGWGQTLRCALYNNRIVLLVPCSDNLFETGSLFKTVYDTEFFRKVIGQMNLLFEVMQVLKTNREFKITEMNGTAPAGG